MSWRRLLPSVASVALALALVGGCSDEPAPVPRPPIADAVKRAIADIERLERDAPDVRVVQLDVAEMTAEAFQARLVAERGARRHLWMPGERDWVLVVSTNAAPVSLARAMERFAEDPEAGSIFETFASYAGTVDEVMPAFRSKLEGTLVPQWFVTKEIPQVGWLDASGLEVDIRDRGLAAMHAVQNARRTLLEGNIRAVEAKDKEGEQKAFDSWSKARRLNPRDPMLLERQSNLRRNAQGFLDVLRIPQAMKCYETLFRIDPNDVAALHNFGQCLKRIGKTELGDKFINRAKELSK